MKFPTIFLGHGSPMNALEQNTYTQGFKKLGEEILKKYGKPKAVLMVSAHWESKGTWVTGMDKPKTIHDFYGFPQKLFEVQYPAKGDPKFAKELESSKLDISNDLDQWGLDHGAWSVLIHLFPKADIPILQLSLDKNKSFSDHFELGNKLRTLREQGVLILGSGNIVHNLKKISWDSNAKAQDWAIEFDEWVKEKTIKRDFQSLIKQATNSESGKLSINSAEHYLPLLYTLGSSDTDEPVNFDVEGIQNGSISMRSVRFG